MGKVATAFVLLVFAGVWTDEILLVIVNLTEEQEVAVISFQYVCWTFALLFALLLIALNIQNEHKVEKSGIS